MTPDNTISDLEGEGMQQDNGASDDRALVSDQAPAGLAASRFDPSREAFDRNGIPFALGDVVKVFHFTGARGKRHYMYKHIVGERVWPSGFRCWLFSHLNMKPADGSDGGYYVAKDGTRQDDCEIVQCCSEYPAHFSTRPRDRDGNPKGGDACGSVHDGPAIAQPTPEPQSENKS